ncbi:MULTISPECIES: PAS domain-containing sensor histidine kinase [unclassified Bradyrhizobium]|uniref:hybrid sensor histidine kinase/response regulator n=1 Tax=unclassified Bradyrhizobium TaxID=2631580 RepID=UPI002013A5BF|nr:MULTISPECIES: PAS domain S-box protein [unclassified Bradyrhizobium]
MTLRSRLAFAMVFLVVGTICALAVFGDGFGRAAFIVGVIAILVALVLAAAIAGSLSRQLTQMTRAVEGLSRGKPVAMPAEGSREMAPLSAAFAELSDQLGAKPNLLENTVESIRDCVVVADENAVVVVANGAARQLLGVDRGFDSLTGVRKFACFLSDGTTPLPIPDSPLARALRGEHVDDFELMVQSEGSSAKAYIVANARPLRDERGRLRGAVTVLRDVTEQRRALQALVDSEQMAQTIVSTALDAFVQTDENGFVLEWSPQAEALTGWTRAETVGVKLVELVFPEHLRAAHRQRIAKFLRETAGGAMGMRYEAPALHRDGHEFFVEVSLTALRRGDGYIINSFVRDVTQRRLAEERLIQAQKMDTVGQLTGGIAHDFNNMLTVITGTIEILADGVKDVPHLASITKLISDAADRGANLTASLLAFARKQPLQPAEIDVNDLIREAVRLLAPSLGKNIEIEAALNDDAWPAFVDRSQLSSAVVNLAINARDAMANGGKLTIATGNITLGVPEAVACGVERAGDYVAVEVSDTGTGIPQPILDKIFEPFFSTKEVGQGTGLGLSMVFGFAKQSGGSVDVRSEEGSGTTFTIYLPKADTSALQPSTQDEDSPVQGGSETLLCVEDDRKIRDYVTMQLESLGYKVIVASNADEALAIVNRGAAFDLLFTDVVMPGSMNGRQLAETLMAGRPSLRVLFTSGYSDGALPLKNRAGHGIPLLTKPYRRAELARTLRRCLDIAVDPAGDPIPTPYSVQPELERFLRKYPPKEG